MAGAVGSEVDVLLSGQDRQPEASGSLLRGETGSAVAQDQGRIGESLQIHEEVRFVPANALARGVEQKTIYQHTIRSHAPTLTYAEEISRAGGEIRTVDEVFDRLIICDRQIAFVPDPASERSDLALTIEHPGVVRYLVGIFQHIWQRAVPIQPSTLSDLPQTVTNDIRRAVLQLMVDGHTDAVIASRLGMSVRSVTNHVRWASDLFGSRSRAQLAYQIGRSGFLGDETTDTAPG